MDQLVFYKDMVRLSSQLREQWKKACQEELEALHKHKVFELADLPPGCKAMKNCWIFTTKSDGHKKARLVAKGFSQVEGIDFDQIFSPVVWYESVCLLLVAAALEWWYIQDSMSRVPSFMGILMKRSIWNNLKGLKSMARNGKSSVYAEPSMGSNR